MSDFLPELVDPRRAARQAASFSGRSGVAVFKRILPLLASQSGGVDFDLQFAEDNRGRAVVRISTRGELWLTCQRCLEAVKWPIDEESTLVLTEGLDEAARLPPECDPLLASEDLLRPLDLVEDELLLAIPPVPRHQDTDCAFDAGRIESVRMEASQTGLDRPVQDPVAASAMGEGEHNGAPSSSFAALAAWKSRKG